MGEVDFRILFGQPVDAGAVLDEGKGIPVGYVIPPVPPGGFLDDPRLYDTDESPGRRYISVRRDQNGPVMLDQIDPTGILQELEPEQGVILAEIALTRRITARDLPVHIPVYFITGSIIAYLERAGHRRASPPTELTLVLMRFFRVLNQCFPREDQVVHSLACYVVEMDLQTIFGLINQSRISVAARENIALESRPGPGFPQPSLRGGSLVCGLVHRISDCTPNRPAPQVDATVRDIRWFFRELGKENGAEFFESISHEVVPRLLSAPVEIQVVILQSIADHFALVPNDELLHQVYGIFESCPSGAEGVAMDLRIVEATLACLANLSQRFPLVVSRGPKFCLQLGEIERQSGMVMHQCEERLGKTRSRGDEGDGTIDQEQRLGRNCSLLCSLLKSDQPPEGHPRVALSWHLGSRKKEAVGMTTE
jgi:hypothetical protein